MDAAFERTGMYSQGELRSKRGCPGVQRVQKTYVSQLLYSLVHLRLDLSDAPIPILT
jgi:hypothetical protein